MRRHKHIKDPVPVAPFLKWVDRQLDLARRELNAWPAVGGDRRTGGPYAGPGEIEHVLIRIGWDTVAGTRRLHRWRHELKSAYVDRAIVEDALWRAGYAFDDVYECAGAEADTAAAAAALGVAGPGTQVAA